MHKLVHKPMHYALGPLLHNFPPPVLVPRKNLCITSDMHYERMHYENFNCIRDWFVMYSIDVLAAGKLGCS